MPRKIRSVDLTDRTSRSRLKPRAKPYPARIDGTLALGYRKGKRSGEWGRRIYIGNGQYNYAGFGEADDRVEANGTTVLTFDQAVAKARELRDAFVQNGAPATTAPLTVAQAVEEYIADLRARKGDTAAREAEGRLRKHLVPEFGDRQLADLTTAELVGWRNSLVAEEGDEEEIRRSRDTANRMRSIAFAVFNFAFNGGRVDDDRAWRRAKPFKNVGEARKVILSEAQQQRLIDACEPGLREFALLVAWTGARPGRELTEARVRDLDLEAKTLRVSGKTGVREIHLPPDALALLRRLASGKRPDEHLLTNEAGAPWTKSLHSRRVAVAVEKAGLDRNTTLYALRHSYISGSLKKGNPADAVARHCGASIAMIQRFYGKWIPSDLAEYADKASPNLRTDDVEQKVVALQPGAA
jgi:integrase